MASLKLKVGILIVVAAVLLAGFLAILGNFSLSSGYRLYVDYDFSGNLQPGAAVKLSGIKVGKVEEVRFMGGQLDEKTHRRVQVRVKLWLEDRAREAIRKDAEFFVNIQGVLGEQYLEVRPGTYEQPPLLPDSIVIGVDPPRTDLIIARLYEFLDSITSLLREDKDVIRDFLKSGASVVRTLDTVLKDNQGEVKNLIVSLDKLSREGAALLASLHAGVGDGASLKRTLANIEALSASVKTQLEPLIAKAQKALDGVTNITSVVGPKEREKLVRALSELTALSTKADAIATDAQAIMADVRKGKGTAGALLTQEQLYDDLKEMVRDLKRNPWKFFWKE
jgi:phospholipid/cholesterol/gamma-HCH transport system substrate-binding protein